tara:strand:+ start:571 stop:1503 length:933 start_codon:yes stop_codon:yes gene_type:complete
MNIALIFPGQGSQYIGMGKDFFDNSTASKLIFNNLDETMGLKLSELIFNGSEEELSKTTNSQPAIMSLSIAILEEINSRGLLDNKKIHSVAGHSLGEYSALVANNSLSFEDSVKLLIVRSEAMQKSMPIGTGGMAAVLGQSEEEILLVIKKLETYGKLFIANDNADGQIVLSGEINAIDYLCENFKALGVKRAIKLPVSAPFHCELINEASLILKEELEKFSFDTFSYPLYSNVTAEKSDANNVKALLSKQVVNRVRWRETIQNMIRDKVETFIEIGPGKVLTNLIKRNTKDIKAVSIGKLSDLDKLEDI